jgi:hypothetical protein
MRRSPILSSPSQTAVPTSRRFGKKRCRGVGRDRGATDPRDRDPARERSPIARDRHPEGQEPPVGQECQAKRAILALIVFTAMWIAFPDRPCRALGLFRSSVVQFDSGSGPISAITRFVAASVYRQLPVAMMLRRLSGRRGANSRRRSPRRQRSVSLAVTRIHNRGEVGCFNFIFFEKQRVGFSRSGCASNT